MMSLGPFVLIGALGSGGMSTVYRAVHRHTRLPVAVKVLTRDLARKERYRHAFRREVRAMARLHHPGIAQIYDMGEVSAKESADSNGHMVEGSPWLATELVEGQPLANSGGASRSWTQLRPVLVELLEAFAHAHSHGVLHCDLKPSNLLLTAQTGTQETRHLKVIDFGLTRLFGPEVLEEREGTEHHVVGTPPYMAPEQIRGQWRDQGPWTDLYAVGCLTWRQITGAPPFVRGSIAATLDAHCNEALPAFVPKFEVPDGVEAWLRRLLDKSPVRRFRRAADALDTPVLRSPVTEPATIPVAEKVTGTVLTSTVPEAATSDAAHRSMASHAATGVGLRLFGVREVPIVSRKAERKQLWDAFSKATDAGVPQAVVVSGAAGLGKSRLARWLERLAHESGAATVLHAVHSVHAVPRDGIAGMLRRHFQCGGLSGQKLRGRLRSIYREVLDIDEAITETETVGLAELLDEGAESRYGFQSPRERDIALARLLRALAKRRPVLMWVDDLHWGHESVRFLRHLLCEEEDLPVFVVATVRSDLPGSLADEAVPLDEFTSLARVECFELSRLDDDTHRQLVNQALALAPDLAERLVRKTRGVPLFALQMIGHWVETDALESGGLGFRAAEGRVETLPGDLGELWRLRIQNTCESVAGIDFDTALESLELAAALGPFVDDREWKEACEAGGLVASMILVDELARRGLVRIVDGGWHFEFGTLPQALGRTAKDDGGASARRWRDHHARCAQMLDRLYPTTVRGVALRRSRHLIESGQAREALAPLLQAEQELYDAGDFDGAGGCLDKREALVEALAEELDDIDDEPLWAMNRWRRARILFARGERGEAAQIVEDSLSVLRHSQRPTEIGAAAFLLGRMLRDDGDLESARPLFDEALEAYRSADDRHGVANALSGIGYLELMTGRHRQALDLFEEALAEFEALEDTLMRGRISLIIGHTLLLDKQPDKSAIYVEESLRLTRMAGDRPTEAEVLRCLGEIARSRNDWQEARRRYEGAIDLHEICGTRAVHLARFDLALTLLAAGEFGTARDLLEEAEHRFPDLGYGARLPFVYAALLACAAGQQDRAGWQRYIGLVQESLVQTNAAHRDIEWAACRAASHARQAGWAEAAEEADAVAQGQRDSIH